MARRLIVDTGVLIASERERRAIGSFIEPDDDVAVAAVTVAELHTGVELAAEPRRASRLEFVRAALELLPVEVYDTKVAEAHARLLAHVHRAGRPRGAHDLLIAATAVATDRTVLTTDRAAGFDELPGVTCLFGGV
ncbi:PIN domain-containing protein [Agromyces archimandritae]|uniref:Ribonuclease VapC n=1 Tax=Agromyces archimandritae TaxID=2781962 RepID=A0A975FL25_9MICO|nr:PIN domain-containing protein [Agromyces archimandritae]QTX03403.1 PIN domain-containing protein [Agromyces archimandritae]